MKKAGYQKRSYRSWAESGSMYRAQVIVEETDLLISSDRTIDLDFCKERIFLYRRQIRAYISRDERFLTSLEPIAVESTAPSIIQAMADESRKAGVGPMAAVAGAIAQYLGKDLLRRGSREVIIENGGDIFLKAEKPVSIGLYAGRSRLSGKLSLRVYPKGRACGVCTSSGTVGHSLSFGSADAVVIVAGNAVCADAAATATANKVHDKGDFLSAVSFARSIRGVRGVLIIVKNDMASWGDMELA